MCMCGFCNVWVCVYMGFVGVVVSMYRFCNVCMYGFFNVCMCVYMGFVKCGCVYVWLL